MSKHNYKTEYISGIDANNAGTIPDTKPYHPIEQIEPLDTRTDYLRGVAVGMRLNQRIMDWLLSSSTENQIHNRALALAFALDMDDLTCHSSIAQVAQKEGINRQFLFKLVDQAKAIVADDPAQPHSRIATLQPSDKYQANIPRSRDDEPVEDDPNQLTMFEEKEATNE